MRRCVGTVVAMCIRRANPLLQRAGLRLPLSSNPQHRTFTALSQDYMNNRFTKPLCTYTLAALLSGCAGVPPEGLLNEGDVSSFAVDMPPEVAYRKIVEGARSCYVRIFDVTADYFPEAHTGRVSASMKTTFAISSAFLADIAPSERGTTIRLASHRSTKAIPANVRKWLNGDYSACGL
jgi:hypothetical protein